MMLELQCQDCGWLSRPQKGWIEREDLKGTIFEKIMNSISDEAVTELEFLTGRMENVIPYMSVAEFQTLCGILRNAHVRNKELAVFPEYEDSPEGKVFTAESLKGTVFEAFIPTISSKALWEMTEVAVCLRRFIGMVPDDILQTVYDIFYEYSMNGSKAPMLPDEMDRAEALLEEGKYTCPECNSKNIFKRIY